MDSASVNITSYPHISDNLSLILQPFGSTLVDEKTKSIRGSFNRISTNLILLCNGKNERRTICIKMNKDYGINDVDKFIDSLIKDGVLVTAAAPKMRKTRITGSFREMTPLYVFIELTRGCNLRCAYCFNNSMKAGPNELSRDQWLNALKILKKRGTKMVAFSGGEPSTKEGFWEIFEYAVKNFYVDLLTNGNVITGLNKKRERLLSRLSSIQISFDSATPEHHERMRGKNSWEIAKKAIEVAKRLKIKTTIASTIVPDNFGQIDGLNDFSKKNGLNLGISALTLKGRAKELSHLVDYDFFKKVEEKKVGMNLNDFQISDVKINVKFPCGPVGGRLAINAEGHLKPCSLPEDVLRVWNPDLVDSNIVFDLEKRPLNKLEIYKETMKIAEIYDGKFVNVKDCGKCPLYSSACQRGCVLAPYYKNKRVLCNLMAK